MANKGFAALLRSFIVKIKEKLNSSPLHPCQLQKMKDVYSTPTHSHCSVQWIRHLKLISRVKITQFIFTAVLQAKGF